MGDRLFASALNALTVQLAVLGEDGRIVAVNEAWRRFAAANGAAHHSTVVEGADYLAASACVDDPDAQEATHGVRKVLAGRCDEFRLEYPCHSPTELRWFELRATPMPGGGAVVAHETITERKLAQQRLEFLAHHDELTGLANRRRVMARLAEAQRGDRLGIVLVDLDRFKLVNDTHGHAAGNDVLRATGEALGQTFGNGSFAGRHGGDEFCVGLLDCDAATLAASGAAICARVRERLARLPYGGAVTVSAGGALAHPAEPLADALHRADEALYAVKRSGRDDFRLAAPAAR